MIFVGCGKQDDKATKANGKSTVSISVPEFTEEDFLLTDLKNCNLEMIKGSSFSYFSGELYSNRKVDEKSIEVIFDTDIKYTVSISAEDAVDEDSFGYTLLCAYNGYKIDKFGEVIDEISAEDYEKAIKGKIPAIYCYRMYVNLDLGDEWVDTYEDKEINNMAVKFNGKTYNFDIGSIVYNPSHALANQAGETIGPKSSDAEIECNEMCDVPMENNKDGLFAVSFGNVIKTNKTEMTITDVKCLNNDLSIDEVYFKLNSESQTMDVKYEGKDISVPQNTEMGLKVLLKNERLKDTIGDYCRVPIIIEYIINGTRGSFQLEATAVGHAITAYELYATDVNKMNLFKYYLGKDSYR